MTHLNIIKIIDYIGGVISILVGLAFGLICILGAGAIGLSGEEGSGIVGVIFGSFGIVFAILFLVMGIVSIIAGSALVGLKTWSRWLHLILAIMNLGNIPIGTAIGIYYIWALFFNEEVKAAFENKY